MTLDSSLVVIILANEALPQTDEMYWFLAKNPRSKRTSLRLGVLCVRSIGHAVCDALDAFFDERNVEVDEQTQTLVRQPQMR